MSSGNYNNLDGTLRQIAFSLRTGVVCSAVALFLFALAIRCQKTNIAPRCEARPRSTIYNPDPDAPPSQQRGNPFLLGWVGWVMKFSYEELIRGVAGTGTRANGLKGRLLNVNVDQILLLRFHALGLKICVVAMFVYCVIGLPAYFYARCAWVPLGEANATLYNCSIPSSYNFTSYSRFTLANVQSLDDNYFTVDHQMDAVRIYAIVFASWLVVWFTMFELEKEWIDLVAMRRVYYLETDVWKERKEELRQTMLGQMTSEEEKESRIVNRADWIPHPEQRDTPPNIELYSVLVGSLPSKPKEVVPSEDLEAAIAADAKAAIDWQLSVTSAFFDACVPNQPGFTSSVAAVTIVPSAAEIALAWNKWTRFVQLLSRLRFVRRRIIALGHVPQGQKIFDGIPADKKTSGVSSRESNNATRMIRSDVFNSTRTREYCAEILGAGFGDNTNDDFFKCLDLGPEQIAVYDREMSLSIAGCCPHGFREELISNCTDIDELLEMEAEAAEDVRDAYLELQEVGNNAVICREKKPVVPNVAEILARQLGDDGGQAYPTTESELLKKHSLVKRKNHNLVAVSADQNRDFRSGLMRMATVRLKKGEKKPWDTVQTIATETKNLKRNVKRKYQVSTGRWACPTVGSIFQEVKNWVTSVLMWSTDNDEAADILARDSTFAVVTFTSRHAAIAARQCLADARGASSFNALKAMPVPPLADASAFNVCDTRGYCKPVTLGLNDQQKGWRKSIMVGLIAFVYVAYTAPVTAAGGYATYLVYAVFPNFPISEEKAENLINGLALNLLLAGLPYIFSFLVNFGSNATSLVAAEDVALQVTWYYYMLFAIIGQSFARMVFEILQSGSVDLPTLISTIARTIPVGVSFTWLGWVITKTFISHPIFYLFQFNTWLFTILRVKCGERLLRGGGDGSRMPFTIYVDSGTVIMCALALAPAAPLLAPFCVLYYLVCAPLLRYLVIFTCKPLFDSGGARWPILFDIFIGTMMVGQILLCAQVILKRAIAAGVLAAIPLIPIYQFRRSSRERFLASYNDAALLQTSQLDGLDVSSELDSMTYDEREEFRRFLVDSHKAAYVPVCIAATNAQNIITVEPAVVQPITQEELEDEWQQNMVENGKMHDSSTSSVESVGTGGKNKRHQIGALNRRHLVSTTNIFSEPSVNVATKNISSTSLSNTQATSGEDRAAPAIRVTLLGRMQEAEGETGEIEYVFHDGDAEQGTDQELDKPIVVGGHSEADAEFMEHLDQVEGETAEVITEGLHQINGYKSPDHGDQGPDSDQVRNNQSSEHGNGCQISEEVNEDQTSEEVNKDQISD